MELPTPHADQYKMLREEIVSLIREARNLEIYVLGAVAALYAWLTKEGNNTPFAAFFIGILLVLLGGIKSFALYKRIIDIAKYLRKIEQELFIDPLSLPGWERYLEKERVPLIGYTVIAFWILMLIFSIIAPFFLHNGCVR